MQFKTIFWRCCRLRCPMCGDGRLFRGWFQMHEKCQQCGVRFEREAGFYLGSIYFNYGLTALIVAIAYPVLLFNRVLPPRLELAGFVVSDKTLLMTGCVLFAVVFPIWFFRYARSLWLGFDQYWDPREETIQERVPSEDPQSDEPQSDEPQSEGSQSDGGRRAKVSR